MQHRSDRTFDLFRGGTGEAVDCSVVTWCLFETNVGIRWTLAPIIAPGAGEESNECAPSDSKHTRALWFSNFGCGNQFQRSNPDMHEQDSCFPLCCTRFACVLSEKCIFLQVRFVYGYARPLYAFTQQTTRGRIGLIRDYTRYFRVIGANPWIQLCSRSKSCSSRA